MQSPKWIQIFVIDIISGRDYPVEQYQLGEVRLIVSCFVR